jgi:type IV secretory pathway VirD2 relaxase
MGNPDDDRPDDFRPRMGRTERARDRVASGSLRVATLVRRGHGRIGAKRKVKLPPAAGFGPRHNARRVIVKAHLHKLRSHGAQAAARHLRYIERDGVEKDGSPGVLYGPNGPVPRASFEQPRLGEQHQFRFIVSPEDARDLDLTDYVRELMTRVESDLGRPIEWAAVNHHDTEHPHAHVVIRGVCREGQYLRMERAYISRGLRWTAQELATERLGPRLEIEIRRTREREITQERFTSLDRELERAAPERRVDAQSLVEQRHGPERALLIRRLEHLENLGLAEKVAPSGWVLAEGWRTHLRDLGQRGDILKQMHRVMSGADPARFHIVRRGQGLPDGHGGVDERVLVGRVVRTGLADELKGRTFYAVLETTTGDAYHVTIGAREADALRVGELVSFATKREAAVQPVDRNIAEVAAARGGVYELAGEADGQDAAARTAARRLRELDRLGVVTAVAPGRWRVPSDLCAQLEERHREAPSRYRVTLAPLPLSLDAQVGRQGPVWLDTVDPARLATKGFGAEVLAAVERRRQALRELGIAPDDPERDAKVRGLERRAVGRDIARQTGQQFLESIPSRFRGRLQSAPEDAPYLTVTDGARFVLIAATPQTRSRTGQTIDLARDASGRVLLAEDPARASERQELARRDVGEMFARENRQTFLPTLPEGFRGHVVPGPKGSPYLAVTDGARFGLVRATPDALALLGKTVDVERDAHGRFLGLRSRDIDRGR